MTTSANSEQELREKISTLLESLIGKTWVELLENAPEVMFAQHDIDIHADLILEVIKQLGFRFIPELKALTDVEIEFGIKGWTNQYHLFEKVKLVVEAQLDSVKKQIKEGNEEK